MDQIGSYFLQHEVPRWRENFERFKAQAKKQMTEMITIWVLLQTQGFTVDFHEGG